MPCASAGTPSMPQKSSYIIVNVSVTVSQAAGDGAWQDP